MHHIWMQERSNSKSIKRNKPFLLPAMRSEKEWNYVNYYIL